MNKTAKAQINNGIDPVKAGIAGAALVAAAGTAVVLSKKENRQKAKKALAKIKVKSTKLRAKAVKGLDKLIREEQTTKRVLSPKKEKISVERDFATGEQGIVTP